MSGPLLTSNKGEERHLEHRFKIDKICGQRGGKYKSQKGQLFSIIVGK